MLPGKSQLLEFFVCIKGVVDALVDLALREVLWLIFWSLRRCVHRMDWVSSSSENNLLVWAQPLLLWFLGPHHFSFELQRSVVLFLNNGMEGIDLSLSLSKFWLKNSPLCWTFLRCSDLRSFRTKFRRLLGRDYRRQSLFLIFNDWRKLHYLISIIFLNKNLVVWFHGLVLNKVLDHAQVKIFFLLFRVNLGWLECWLFFNDCPYNLTIFIHFIEALARLVGSVFINCSCGLGIQLRIDLLKQHRI